MRGYSEIEVFTGVLRSLLHYANYTVEAYPDFWGEGRDYVRCHEVARAVAVRCASLVAAFGVTLSVVDGLYGTADHSWIVVTVSHKNGRIEQAILDPYAVGRLPLVQLVYPLCAHLALYTGRPARLDIRQDVLDRLLKINKRLGNCIGCRGLYHSFECPENEMCL